MLFVRLHLRTEVDDPFRPMQTPLGGSSGSGEIEDLLDGPILPLEGEYFAETGNDENDVASTRSGGRGGTLCSDQDEDALRCRC